VNIILPLGLSYLIFTAMAYLIDIKRQEIHPERHLGILASYFLFFPKVAQGPIERAGHVLPQFHRKHHFDYDGITAGLKLMAWGFFKKLVIADSLAVFVNAVYSSPQNSHGLVLITGTVCFAFQLYADFSGYTDIALGSAQVLGFDLMQNFRRPYLARSVRDFWTRWHISLSSWCSDYVFLPIVEHTYDLKRKLKKIKFLHRLSAEKIMYVAATLSTFIIIGIWHGVGWNYLIVGLLFGFYVSFDMLTKNLSRKINIKTGVTKRPLLFQNIQIVTTFFLVCLPWIFFRANSMNDAVIMIQNLFQGWSLQEIKNSFILLYHNGINERLIIIMFLSTILLIITDILSEKKDILLRIAEKPLFIRWAIYYLLIIAIIAFSTTESKQFIYMQF
jgi:D-alanyl-lipoteichoic acid acyltransferase DltB (MBOAT superfamily)